MDAPTVVFLRALRTKSKLSCSAVVEVECKADSLNPYKGVVLSSH